MKSNKFFIVGLVLIALAAFLVACQPAAVETAVATPCPEAAPCPTCPEAAPCPTAAPCPDCPKPVVENVPYADKWVASGHNNVTGEQFRHWDDAAANPDGVPTSCAKCHSTAGYLDFLGADGSEAGKVDAPVPAADAQGVQCIACHDPAANNMSGVAFPGKDEEGNAIMVEGLGDATRCLVCHQGRESKASIDGAIEKFAVTDVDAVVAPIKAADGTETKFGFRNIHYFAAAATLFGTETKGGYEYEGKAYDAQFRHVEGYDTCVGCHDPHSLEVKVEECAECHEGVTTVEDLQKVRMVSSTSDYDGDGNVEEGVAEELTGMQEALLAAIQTYAKDKAGAEIVYDAVTYPYFMGTDGKAYPNWTARLLKAAYNYQLSVKDPGKFAHGGKYVIELVYDSIEDLGGDVSMMAREDAGHFAGNTMAFRDWDDTGTVPYNCAKCHSATGLPEFIKGNGTVAVLANGSILQAGVGPQPTANGFMCSTCHNTAEFPAIYAVGQAVFPSGKSLTFSTEKTEAGANVAVNANICIMCHQGRTSKLTLTNDAAVKATADKDTVNEKITAKNIHYFTAGATLFGTEAQALYEYADKTYNGRNLHAPGFDNCLGCHDKHSLVIKEEACATCHAGKTLEEITMTSGDLDGDGTVEGVKVELEQLRADLLVAIQAYAEAKSKPIAYEANNWYLDADKDGKADRNDAGSRVSYNGNFTPNLLFAAYNFRTLAYNDPGTFAHNPKYVAQVLIDTIEAMGGDVSKYTRPEVPDRKSVV